MNPRVVFLICILLSRAEERLDIRAHLSQPASGDLLGEYHLVLVMENDHKEILQAHYPEFADRIVLFMNLVGGDGDFEDSVGGSLDRYRRAAEELESILKSEIGEIEHLSRAG